MYMYIYFFISKTTKYFYGQFESNYLIIVIDKNILKQFYEYLKTRQIPYKIPKYKDRMALLGIGN